MTNANIPALIVSGDRSEATLRIVEASGFMFITKPVKSTELLAAVATLTRLARSGRPEHRAHPREVVLPIAASDATIAIVDDEPGIRDALRSTLQAEGHAVALYSSGEAFFADERYGRFRCLVVDLTLPGMGGLALLHRLKREKSTVPVIFLTASADLAMAVQAMREGAADFLQKPVRSAVLRESVARALGAGRAGTRETIGEDEAAARLATLTDRERQVLEGIIAGHANKNIAADLGISQRTAEHHRHNLMRKLGVRSVAMLVRVVDRSAR